MNDYSTKAIFTSFNPTSPGDELKSSSAAEQSRRLEQLSDDEFWAYARRLAVSAPLASPPEEYLTCVLSRETGWQCLIPLATLYEIVRPPHRIAPLPAIPAWMKGLVAWRGEIIAVVDLNAYLSGDSMDGPHEGMLVIANYAGLPLGLLVSACGAVISAQGEDSLPPPAAPNEGEAVPSWWLAGRAAYVKGVRDKLLVLDMDGLLGLMVQEIGGAASNG
jgi:chemotaxis signal transduction protein